MLDARFPGLFSKDVGLGGKLSAADVDDLRRYRTAMDILSQSRVLDALLLKGRHKTLPDLSDLFSKALKLSLHAQRSVGVVENSEVV